MGAPTPARTAMSAEEWDLFGLLKDRPDSWAKAIVENPKYLKAMAKQLKYMKDYATAKDPTSAAVALVSTMDNGFTTGLSSASSSTATKGVAFASNQIAKSVSLLKVAGMASPGKAVATVGLVFAEKVVLAGGLVATSEQAKCATAWAGLATSGASMALTGWTGIGAVFSAAAIAASAYDVYASCRAP